MGSHDCMKKVNGDSESGTNHFALLREKTEKSNNKIKGWHNRKQIQ